MNIDAIAAQLKASAALFNGNVAGAARFADSVEDQVWLPSPAAYVVPGDDQAGENESQTGLYQIVSERIGVIVVLATPTVGGITDLTDRRGQGAAAYLRIVRSAIFKAILNWRPDWDPANPASNIETRGLYYTGAELLEFDRARFFYQFNFGLDTLITDDDGWLPSGDLLIQIQSTITNGAGGGTLATSKISLPVTG